MTILDKAREQVSFLFKDAGDSIFYIQGIGLAALSVDVIDSEKHRWDNEVSNYPVEGEEDISDNIKQKPDELTVTCFVSNTPIHGVLDAVVHAADRFLNGRKRTADCFNQLKALRDLRIPVTVATRYRVYDTVAITSVEIVREPDNGESLTFDVTFREINITVAQVGDVPAGIGTPGKQAGNATKTRAGVKTDAGKSTGKTTSIDSPDAPKPVVKSVLKVLTGG